MNIAERLDQLWGVAWTPLLNGFRVSPPSRVARVVFIGESPHTDEVRSGDEPEDRSPLAGDSGKKVTAKLRGVDVVPDHESRPIGQLATSCVDWLSIVNVAEVPLQAAAYASLVAQGDVSVGSTDTPTLTQWLKLMYSFELIRGGFASTRREPFADEVDHLIKADFECRVRAAVGERTRLVVALGGTAAAYYGNVCADLPNARCAAHPSSKSNWNVSEEVLNAIKEAAVE